MGTSADGNDTDRAGSASSKSCETGRCGATPATGSASAPSGTRRADDGDVVPGARRALHRSEPRRLEQGVSILHFSAARRSTSRARGRSRRPR
jgi:hypothetical protein